MNMRLRLLFLSVIAFISSIVANAYDFQVNGIYYFITNHTKNCVEVVRNSKYSGIINIPQKVLYNGVEYLVTGIGESAFNGFADITSITIPNSVDFIDNFAFMNCTGLKSITIPSSVKDILGRAFEGCEDLTEVNISDLKAWCNIDFSGAKSNPLFCAKRLYLNGNEIKDLVIPEGITEIKHYTFSGSNISNVTIPNLVTRIGIYAFGNCTGLTSVEIPNSVTDIDNGAFVDCTGLKRITIGNSVEVIRYDAFSGCTGLTEFYSHAVEPPICLSNSFEGVDLSNSKLYVPESSIEKYRNAAEWKDWVNISAIKNFITAITLDKESVLLKVNETLQLQATITPTDATDTSIVWKSSDENIVAVDNGLITAKAIGNATITVTAADGSGISATCNVSVIATPVESVSIIADGSTTINIGETVQLRASVQPEASTNKTVAWTSSNESVAAVDNNGLVTAISIGTTTITATANDGSGSKAECEVTVLEDAEPIEEINFFSVADIEVRPGKSFTFPVELINEDAISGFQCDIYLPEGITAELYEDEYDIVLTDRKTSSHSISSALQPDGSIRVAVFSSKSKAFLGNDGAIFEIMLLASEDLQDVTQIAIKNIVLATPDLTQFTPADITANVILKKYILGDANGDETVNITDAVGVVNTILGNEPASFVFDAADVVADGTINITDAIGVVNIILNGQPTTTALAQQPIKATLSATSAGNKFYIEDFSIEAGEEKEIAILLTNDVAFSGFQADIYLPEGLSIYQEDDEYIFDLSSRATRSHSISSALQADGAYRIACFSSSSKDIKENEGELVYFTVIADDDFSGTHTITVKNTIFTQSDLTQYNLDETTATVTGPNIQAIEDIIADEDANAPVEYYNLQGVRVENPKNGIFIRRQGNKVEKVILK